jgi:hypothetical protein
MQNVAAIVAIDMNIISDSDSHVDLSHMIFHTIMKLVSVYTFETSKILTCCSL